jgi:hypothetical protein
MALGELIEESRGKTTNERVLDVDPPKVVTSFKMKGNFKGTLCTEIGSYTAVLPCIETRPSETVQVGLGQSDLRHAARKNEALTSLIKYVLNISSMAFIYCKKCGEYRYLTPHA